MKLVRYRADGAARYGVLERGFVYEAMGDVFTDDVERGNPIGGLEKVALLPPCEPATITSIGANYVSRCEENGLAIPTEPGKGDRFYIHPEALTGPGDLIHVPTSEGRVEYSGELGIVMRRTAKDVTVEEAPEHILGYTIVHNLWAKNPKGSAGPEPRTRAYRSFCPAGPCVATGLDTSNLAWETRVNGEVRQRANTSEMLFGVAQIVANISTWHTLQPGDLIQCGTAAGVGLVKHGDLVEIEFAGIGVLRNLAVASETVEQVDLVRIEYKGD